MTYNVFGGTLNLAQLNSTRGMCGVTVELLLATETVAGSNL